MPTNEDDKADGSWSRPDAGVDPAEYVEEDATEESAADDASPDPASPGDDPMAPGQSVAGDDAGDAVEPNEPA